MFWKMNLIKWTNYASGNLNAQRADIFSLELQRLRQRETVKWKDVVSKITPIQQWKLIKSAAYLCIQMKKRDTTQIKHFPLPLALS